MSNPYVYVWAYDVKPERLDEFRELYGASGSWVALFSKAPGYVDTQLLSDRNDRQRFLTIDRWESEEAFVAFRREHADEFRALDLMGEDLTTSETPIGEFGPAEAGQAAE